MISGAEAPMTSIRRRTGVLGDSLRVRVLVASNSRRARGALRALIYTLGGGMYFALVTRPSSSFSRQMPAFWISVFGSIGAPWAAR